MTDEANPARLAFCTVCRRNVSSDNSMMAGTKPAVAHAALESTADGKVSKSRSKQQRKKSQTMQRQDSK